MVTRVFKEELYYVSREIDTLCCTALFNIFFTVTGDFMAYYHCDNSWTLRKLEWKYLESFEMWCWRRMEKIKWSEKVTNEQVLDLIGEKRTLNK